MIREEMKKMLPIIQAYIDGKTVEYHDEHKGEWIPFDKEYSFFITLFDTPEGYRIKPEPKYRPFKDAEECWNEMQKHQPFGWMKGKDVRDVPFYENVTTIMEWTVLINSESDDDISFNYEEFMKNYTFADGTPFGIKEGVQE